MKPREWAHTVLDIAGKVRVRGRILAATAQASRGDTGEVVAGLEAPLFPRLLQPSLK